MTAPAHHFHAAAWLDHREAKVFEFGLEGVVTRHIHAHDRHSQIHAKAQPTAGSGHSHHGDKEFFAAIAKALEPAGEIVLMGPSTAKVEFRSYLQDHAPIIAKKVLAVEPANHPSDGQILQKARDIFHKLDRMLPQHR